MAAASSTASAISWHGRSSAGPATRNATRTSKHRLCTIALLGIGSLAVPDSVGGGSPVPGNLFVPIDLLKPVIADLVARGRAAGPARPWLGVSTQDVEGNVIVTRVASDSPADRALRVGDVIVALGGETLKGQADFYVRLWRSGTAGQEIVLDVLRDGRIQRVTVKSVDRDTYYRPRPTY